MELLQERVFLVVEATNQVSPFLYALSCNIIGKKNRFLDQVPRFPKTHYK